MRGQNGQSDTRAEEEVKKRTDAERWRRLIQTSDKLKDLLCCCCTWYCHHQSTGN